MPHIVLHFVVPAVVALWIVYRLPSPTLNWTRGIQIYFIMMATMLVDLDHLLATPIYDASRCSIGFHPLHEPVLIGMYALLCIVPRARYVGFGLVIHMILDSIDCQLTNQVWFV